MACFASLKQSQLTFPISRIFKSLTFPNHSQLFSFPVDLLRLP
jgi:hypothetical protein